MNGRSEEGGGEENRNCLQLTVQVFSSFLHLFFFFPHTKAITLLLLSFLLFLPSILDSEFYKVHALLLNVAFFARFEDFLIDLRKDLLITFRFL